MTVFSWTPDMSVGVKAFDEDHNHIIVLINELNDAIHNGSSKNVLSKTIDEMVRYVNFHFRREEEAFKQTFYPGVEQQIKEHRAFAAHILREMEEFYNNPKESLPTEILNYLIAWWTNHIQNEDQKYTAHLNANGIF